MIFQPVTFWWLLLIIGAPPIGFAIWMMVRASSKSEKVSWLRRLSIVVLIVLILLRPSIPGAMRTTGSGSLDVYFAIDTTTSMSAEDYNGSNQRIDGVRQDVKDITKELAGARFSVITFDNQALSVLPLTSDASSIQAAVDTLSVQEVFYGIGSSIDTPLDLLSDELGRIKKNSPGRARVVFYMGDGEQTADTEPKTLSPLKPLVDGGAVLGYGTASGGKMPNPYADYAGSRKYITDHSDKSSYEISDAVSKLDENNLKNIANQVGISYAQRTAPGNIKALTSEINIGSVIAETRDTESYEDLYWILSILVVALLSFDGWSIYILNRSLKKSTKFTKEQS